MTIYNKPSDLPAWAESGDKVQPSDAEIQTGWPLSTVPPSRQRFNWLLNWLATGVRYFMQRGVPEWDLTEEYPAGARVQYNEVTYVSLSGTSNIGEQPDTSATFWERWGYSESELSAFNDAYLSKSVAGGVAVTLTAAEARKAIFNFTGALTANINVIIPAAAKRFIVRNNTSGAFTLTVKTSGGTGVAVAQGSNTTLYCDGTNVDYAAKSGETAAQFDNDTSLATTAFVQAIGLKTAAQKNVAAAGNILAADAGKLINLDGTPGVVNLPAANSVPVGSILIIFPQQSGWAISRTGADNLNLGGAILSTKVLGAGDTLFLQSDGGANWNVFGGAGQLSNSSVFASSVLVSGYQKFPTGLILQWGTATVNAGANTTVNLPIAMPNSLSAITASVAQGALTASVFAAVEIVSNSQFRLKVNTGTGNGVYWTAIGN